MLDESSINDYTLNLPPHIEARFFKKRCRPTSLKATTTTSELHPTERAQTRRASILESRKNILRARALHAEKVRSRSLTNSHEALAARLTALQKSLSKAQKSRNAILAKTAAACSNEVSKAKQVAQEIKLKREAELKALKDGMEDKLMEAEKRRLELQSARRNGRRSRGSSSSNKADEGVEGPLKSVKMEEEEHLKEMEAEAVVAIQRAFRLNRNRQIVKKFIELGLSIESVRDIPFDEVTALFREERVQKATERLLRLCGLLQVTKDISAGREDVLDTEKACRTFLSAYVILGHPAEVLSHDGDDEKALITKSKDLLCAFESWISSTSLTNNFMGSPFPRDLLSTTWDDFSSAFSSWKERDAKVLLNGLLKTFAELDLIWQKVKDDTNEVVADDYKEGIREAQLKLLVRIRKLAGDKTRGLVKRAVNEARRTRLPKKEDHKPRGVDVQNPPRSEEVSSVTSNTASAASVQPAPVVDEPTVLGMTNRQIVHELALDKDFRLKPAKKSALEQMVEKEAKRAFFTMMSEGIQNGDDLNWIPSMAQIIKEKLLRLFEPAQSFYKLVDNAIDIQLIEQQCRQGSYDYRNLFAFVFSLLPKICSPARDADVQALVQGNEDYIGRLNKLLDVLDLLMLDQTNYVLMRSAPLIIPEAIPYERRLFATDLEAGRISLEQTKRWLNKARDEKIAEARSRDPQGVTNPTAAISATAVYNHAFMNLTISLQRLTPSEVPETFHLDLERLISYRETVRKIVLSSAALLTIKNLLRRDVRSSWKNLKVKVVALLEKSFETDDSTSIASDICLFIQETSALPPSVEAQIKSAITRITGPAYTDPVVRLVFNRLRNFISARLNAANSKERVKLVASASDTLVNFGMSEQVGDVVGFVDVLEKLASLNRNTYAGYYDKIIQESTEGAASSSASANL